MAKILVTPRSLTKGGDPALELLKKAGHELVFCTPGKAPDEAELLAPGARLRGLAGGRGEDHRHRAGGGDSLKAISRNGTGVDSIDLAACARRGIAVLRAEGANARGVAELTLALILSLLRSVPFGDARLKAGGWERRQGTELEGKTLGVIGTGRIGKLVTRFALALDMKVLGFDAFPGCRLLPRPGFRYAALDELLESSHVVTLHCPHTPGEKPIIDRDSLARMKKGAVLVNTARAGLVDDAAVLASLNDGRLAGYAVDAYDKEPPGPEPAPCARAGHCHAARRRVHRGERGPATRVAVDNLLAALAKAG